MSIMAEVPNLDADELWMEEALRSAQRALEAGEVPVGAVVVHDGRIVGIAGIAGRIDIPGDLLGRAGHRVVIRVVENVQREFR